MSNLVTLASEQSRPSTEPAIATKVPDIMLVTSAGGSAYVLDTKEHTYRQVKMVSILADIITTMASGTYWSLKPDPPIDGQDLVIWGPRSSTDVRPQVIELTRVRIEPHVE